MRNNVFQVIKAACLSLAFALVYALIFTLIVHLFSLPAEAIKVVNQIFKIIGVALGAFVFVRDGKGLIKGAVAGVISTILTFAVFSIIAQSFSISWKIIIELLLGAAAGAIAGVIAVNVKSRGGFTK